MGKFKIVLMVFISSFTLFLGYEYMTYEPGYCLAEKRLITDVELIQSALKMRQAEIAHYGGIDQYEKHFIKLNRNPEEAGRDFDVKDADCCQVYRGKSAAKKNCGIEDYPLCVRLRFPSLKELPKGMTYYKREGRTYVFDECGKLQKSY